MAEQLALGQGRTDRATVDDDERAVAALRIEAMQGLGEQLLAGAGLAGDQHVQIAERRDAGGPGVEALHHLAVADDTQAAEEGLRFVAGPRRARASRSKQTPACRHNVSMKRGSLVSSRQTAPASNAWQRRPIGQPASPAP